MIHRLNHTDWLLTHWLLYIFYRLSGLFSRMAPSWRYLKAPHVVIYYPSKIKNQSINIYHKRIYRSGLYYIVACTEKRALSIPCAKVFFHRSCLNYIYMYRGAGMSKIYGSYVMNAVCLNLGIIYTPPPKKQLSIKWAFVWFRHYIMFSRSITCLLCD